MTAEKTILGALVVWFAIAFTGCAAWITHVIACIKVGSWGFLIAGSIAPPVGIIHGIGIWIGAW